MAEVFIQLVLAAIEVVFAAPTPQRGERFQSSWRAKSFGNKVRTVFTWVFFALFMAFFLMMIVLALWEFARWAIGALA